MDTLRVSIIQTDIVWENKQENLRRLRDKLETLCGTTEIIVLPETFSTGFTMNPSAVAEPANGATINTLQQWAEEFQIALLGSFISSEGKKTESPLYYNRGFFISPEGENFYYDKHHLFRMGGESEVYTQGKNRPIIHYREWNILLQICYDLRFPVWSRNVGNEYDLLVYVANWPATRRKVWDTLLQARALENMCYLCGVNRIGLDANELHHNGGSIVYSPKGEPMASIPDDEEGVATTELSLSKLRKFREKFPVWKDADPFSIS